MLKSKSFLSLDFGAGSLRLAEFEASETGGLRLKQFGMRTLGLEGSQDSAREKVLKQALQELLTEKSYGSKVVNICAPSFQVFSKFVKLPPVDSSKVTQIIQYEAQQNVPFPLEEVAWDYQILGTTPSGELEVLLVAIKSDLVEALFRVAEANGFRVQIVDVAPASLCNCFRYNYSDLDGCTMLLDIGAKTSNVLFFEKGKVFSRSINIGSNMITQDFVAETKMPFGEAEKFKIAEGFVSLGGAYEEPDNPKQAAVSKVARQVMTRLHIQVNQTIQFYRGQQGGSAPTRVFLAGGASIMPYTAQFFSEKLNLAVEYLNPFRSVQIDPGLNVEDLAKVAHSFGEVVGLGLRNLAQCPVEMNLMPKSSRKRQEFNAKKPYFIAAILSLVAVVYIYGWFKGKVTTIKQEALESVLSQKNPLKEKDEQLAAELDKLEKLKKKSDKVSEWLEQRFFWADLLSQIRQALLKTEASIKQELGVEGGVWIESFTPVTPDAALQAKAAEQASDAPRPMMMDPLLAKRYGLRVEAPPPVEKPGKAAAVSTNEIAVVNVNFRAINLYKINPTANNKVIYPLEKELKAIALFDDKETKLTGQIEGVTEAETTFGFGVTLKLKKPIKY